MRSRLVSTLSQQGYWQEPVATAWLLQLSCVAQVILQLQYQKISRIKLQTFHCLPLIKHIPKK
jgi:hypothetical protein